MARGKIEIKKIENPTNRQVTYSKRRNGIFKKANELSVLCDAKVSIIMASSTGKIHEYISPSTTTKQILDQYQNVLGIDIWSSHYEKMQDTLTKLKEVNKNLRRHIRHRMGECLNDLSHKELLFLQQDMEESVKIVREKKNRVLSNQFESYKKKVKGLEQQNEHFRNGFEYYQREDPQYGFVDNGGGMIRFQNEAPLPYAYRLQRNTNVHSGSGSSDLTTYPLLE